MCGGGGGSQKERGLWYRGVYIKTKLANEKNILRRRAAMENNKSLLEEPGPGTDVLVTWGLDEQEVYFRPRQQLQTE